MNKIIESDAERYVRTLDPKRTIQRFRPSDITVDQRVQRTLDLTRVENIVKHFDDEAVGVLTVSLRPDGVLVCLDGQHRAKALEDLGLGDTERDMVTYEGLTLADEARLFRLLNNTKKPNVIDLFGIAVTEGKPEELAVKALVERHGYVISNGHRNTVMAVKTLLRLWGYDDGKTLDRVFFVITGTWGVNRDAAHTAILGGLGALLHRHGDAMNISKFIDKMKSSERTADVVSLVGMARANARANSKSVPDAMATVMLGVYNTSLKQNRLPDW